MSRTLGNTIGAQIGLREGCAEIVHTYPFQYSTTGISFGVLADGIIASETNPVYLEISLQILIGFNDASANEISIGTSPGNGDLLVVVDPNTTIAGYYPASNAATKVRISADTNIYIAYVAGDSSASSGSALLIVKEFTQNAMPIV